MRRSPEICLEPIIIQRFLNDQLTDAEELSIQEHLGSCKNCQAHLDSIVTRGIGWDAFRERLQDFSCESEPSLEELNQGANAESLDFTTIFAPSDNPNSLGRLGRYEIRGFVGRGSTGVVFKAHDPNLDRLVAIKMLAPGLAYHGTSRLRFEREGRAIASVRDPHVIEVHEVDEFREKPYIVMQYFPGGSLAKRLECGGWLTTKEVCCLGMQIARGLAAAHHQGIIHRDIKPANILLEKGIEGAVVSDFGLASVADEATMTFSGIIAGTPQFMSPEQARGQSLDERTDLFSLGCVMYAACTGCSPFRGETFVSVIHRVCESEPRPIREINSDIEEWLEAFILRLLSKQRGDRVQTAEEVDTLLTQELAFLRSPTTVAPPARDWFVSQPQQKNHITKGLIVFATLLVFSATVLWILFSGTRSADPKTIFGIAPTKQEQVFFEAKAAYDLAYETHISEAQLRGDMDQSIGRHEHALELGYDKGRTAFNLAKAYSLQVDPDRAIYWLNKAIEFGFHDINGIVNENELRRLHADPRFETIVNRVNALAKRFVVADRAYFREKDYSKAASLYREWLKECPEDEHAIMMLGASLLEQGKYQESKGWNERTRYSVRYANFGQYNLACIALSEGDRNLAFDHLNYSIEIGFSDAEHLENDHQLTALRDDPRFDSLLQKIRDKNRAP